MTTDFFEINRVNQANLAKRKSQQQSSLVFGDTTKPSVNGHDLGSSITASTTAFLTPQTSFKSAEPYIPLYKKYFNEADIPKAIWTAQWESGHRSESALAPGSDGATGIFRIQNLPGRPSPQQLLDPEANFAYASELAYGPGGYAANKGKRADFTPWGDNGALYNGKPYGALSQHPYPGDKSPNAPTIPSPIPAGYDQQLRVWEEVSNGYGEMITAKSQEINDYIQQNQVAPPKNNTGGGVTNLITGLLGEDNSNDLKRWATEMKVHTDEVNRLRGEQAKLVDEKANSDGYLFLLGQVQHAVFDADTNVKSYEDLVNYIGPIFEKQTGRKLPVFSDDQKKFLDTSIKAAAQFVVQPNNPISEKQLLEFLTTARQNAGPSKRVSIAGLSNQQIRSALTTLPGVKLPTGLDEEKLRSYFASQNLISPEGQKEIDKLKGTFAEQVKKWAELDNKYQAYKLNLATPFDNGLLKQRSSSILAWPIEMLDEYSKHVTRPLASGLVLGYDQLIHTPVIGNALSLANPASNPALRDLFGSRDVNFPYIGNVNPYSVDVDVDELKSLIKKNQQSGQSTWTAWGNGFKDWDTNGLVKLLAETAADPTTYIGFGIYPKIFSKVPILGHAVQAAENGWKLAFDNPVVTRVGLSATGGLLTYQATGDWRPSLAVAGGIAGLGQLRGMNVFTSAQLLRREKEGLIPELISTILQYSNKNTLAEVNEEDIIASLAKALEDYKANPSIAHLQQGPRTIKGLLSAYAPWFDNTEAATWLTRLGEGESLSARTAVKDVAVPAASRAVSNLTDHELLSANRLIDNLLNSSERGIHSIDEVATEMMKLLRVPNNEGTFAAMKNILQDRITNNLDSIISNAVTGDVDKTFTNLIDNMDAPLKAKFEHPLWHYGNFQGYVLGALRKVESIQRWTAYQWMASAQRTYAGLMLKFPLFGGWNVIEDAFRAGINGYGFTPSVRMDFLDVASHHLGWNRNLPIEILSHQPKMLDAALTNKDRSVAARVAASSHPSDKPLHVADIINPLKNGGLLNHTEGMIKGSTILRGVPDEFARANPEGHAFLQEQAQKASNYLRSNTSLKPQEIDDIVTDAFYGSYRKEGAPEYIRNLATDLPSLEKQSFLRDVAQSMTNYKNIPVGNQDYIIQQINRGRINDIPGIIEEVNTSMLDHFMVKAELGEQYIQGFADSILKSIDELESPDDLAHLLSHINEAQIAVSSGAGDIKSAASIRAGTLSTDTAKDEMWNYANASLSKYLETSSRSIEQMAEALRLKIIPNFSEEQARTLDFALDTIIDRSRLMADTRRSLDDVIEDFTLSNGRRPRGAEWDSLIAKRGAIWEDHFTKESNLIARYNTAATNFNPVRGDVLDASSGLTVNHIAELMSSSGDSLAQGLVQLDAIMPKKQFIGTIKGVAEAKAANKGTTAELLGWTDESIGQVYDNLRIRMGTDAAEDTALLIGRQELNSLQKDMEVLKMNYAKKPEDVEVINGAMNTWANNIQPKINEQWNQSVDKAFERAHLRYKNTFTDYSRENIFDAFMKTIDPFWTYQSQRWPYLFNAAMTHPGIVTSWGRYRDYTENGYLHVPGADIALNPFRGTLFMGGFGGMVRQFPGAQESGILGGLAAATDWSAKAGFYPGLWATLPLAIKGINDIELPPILESAIDLTALSPIDLGLIKLRDDLLPSKFRDYYTSVLVSDHSQKNGLEFNGNDVRRHIEQGSATEEEKALWSEMQKKTARYNILFQQTGVFKLDPETKREANHEVAQIIAQITGVPPEQQDAIYDRIGSSGLRLSDVLPLDPTTQKQLNELNKYKLWSGLSNTVMPTPIKDMRDRIDEYWEAVEKVQTKGRTEGFEDSRHNKFESLAKLDEQFRKGEISGKVWLDSQAKTRQQMASEIAGLRDPKDPHNRYKDVPITLDEKLAYYDKTGVPVPVDHPAKELINTYYGLYPKPDKDGNPDWDTYYATVDSLIESLPADRKRYFLDYIQREWTPTQKLYWEVNNKYIRPYRNIRETVLQALVPEQQDFINKYERASAATIDNLPEQHKKLLSDFSSATSRANTRFRQLSPTVEAWLYYFDKVSELSSEAARSVYNDLTRRFPGPKPLTVPIKEKPSLLPNLPIDKPTNPSA